MDETQKRSLRQQVIALLELKSRSEYSPPTS